MIVYRDGRTALMCDRCFALIEGVAVAGPGGFRAAPAHTAGNGRGDKGRAVVQAAQPDHYCARCAGTEIG